MRFFKSNIFCLKIRFSQAQHAISELCLFSKTGVFYATFFLVCFYRTPPQFLLETKRFGSIKDCSWFSCTKRLTGTYKNFVEKFRKNFSSIFCFFKGFRLRKMGFLLFPVGEEWFSRLIYAFDVYFLTL